MLRKSALAIAVLFVLAPTAPPALAQMDHSKMNHGAVAGASKEYMDAMTKMDAVMGEMEMTGKPGADFAAMMIPHHQAAIDMAKSYLASGENDPELTQMSKDIIVAQEREIAVLREWLARHK